MRSLQQIAVLGAVLGTVAAVPLLAQQIQVSGANRTVALTATAEARSKADTATLHIGYQLYAPTTDAVTDEAGRTSRAIVDALAAAGVAKDEIQSESQGTGPVEPYQQNGEPAEERAQRRFQAQQTWTVRIVAGGAAKVLAAATAAGANTSGQIEWSVADEDTLTAQAATKALKRAREVAEQMAAGLGVRLGALLYASNEAQNLRVMPLMQANRADILGGIGTGAGIERKTLSLSPPDITRSATVSAVFAIQ